MKCNKACNFCVLTQLIVLEHKTHIDRVDPILHVLLEVLEQWVGCPQWTRDIWRGLSHRHCGCRTKSLSHLMGVYNSDWNETHRNGKVSMRSGQGNVGEVRRHNSYRNEP